MQSITLNNGHKMPVFGLGTWKSKPGEVTEAVKNAISLGYRHIDCAYVYGNEAEVGAGLKAKMDDGTVKREDLFITSKLWNASHSKGSVLPALQTSLKNLGLAYLDLYLIHWPMGYKENAGLFPKDDAGKTLYSNIDYMETWLALEETARQGLARSIGVSNFNKDQIDRVIAEGTIVPANNQVECHPNLTQVKLFGYCKSKGISVTAYSPLGSPDRPWAKPEDPVLTEDPRIIAIANKYNKTPAQILIAFQIHRGLACLAKSVNKGRIEANIKVFDFKLSAEDIATITSFDCNTRICAMEGVKDHPHWPFNTEF